MKARWVSLVIVLVLLNYLIISTLWNTWGPGQPALPTLTRTPKPTFTPGAVVLLFMTATSTPRPSPLVTVELQPLQASATPTMTDMPVLANPTATPAPVTATSTSLPAATSTPVSQPATATPSLIIHTVKPGDTLLALAVQYDVTTDAIMKANNLTDQNVIYAGQQLIIPKVASRPAETQTPASPVPPATSFIHIVVAGDSLSSIAARYGITVEAIVEANGLTSTTWIYVGQRLIIPATHTASTPAARPTGRTHIVKAGENLTWIAAQYGVTVEAIMRANNISNPDTIYVGQVLIIP